MPNLATVDRLEVHILVDNVTDGLSSVPSFAESEMAYHWRRGMTEMAGACLCCAAHGLSCLITVHRGDEKRTLLFDTGPDADVFARNVRLLKLDLGQIESIVLSHGHWDHAGGMLAALDLIGAANGGKRVPYYAHPGMFRSRASKAPDGTMRPMQDVPTVAALTARGADVVVTTAAQAALGGGVFVSGEIPRVTPFERGLPGQHRRTEDGSGWELDELLMDERFLAVHVRGKGLVVFSACSHAGIVNVLTHARSQFAEVPLYGVMGGLHLSGTNEAIIPETVAALKAFDLKVIAAGHCTGWRAIVALANAVGGGVLAPLAVGKRFVF
jgi:7,8-dihydropterin-6-yl-methyl-4-(beta-D-ribofuranosyl)aminobenzene 5'-phosphate synthase